MVNKPIFNSDQIDITRLVADKVAQVFNSLVERGEQVEIAQRFALQCVVALFAEDIDLLPRKLFTELLNKCQVGQGNSDELIGGLFRQMGHSQPALMNSYDTDSYDRYIPYFNVDIFSQIAPISLTKQEITLLLEAAQENWSQVEPAIFGTLFESSLGKAERHALGAHYTSEEDIQKVILPTIIYPWRERIESAKTLEELLILQKELSQFKVLDPACGSGNFLYVAYREMKRLETKLIIKMQEKSGDRYPVAINKLPQIQTTQFYGIDIKPFAVELAKITLMIAKKLALDEARYLLKDIIIGCGKEDNLVLPLDNLNENICCDDALFCEWETVDAIVGNPPFLGGHRQRLILGDEYVDRLVAKFPEVKGSVDICVYWFRLAHDHLKDGCRAGLVATNSISQGQSRRAALDYIMQNNGCIYDVISTQPWTGAAKVHISIINWLKISNPRISKPSGTDKNLETQKLIYRLDRTIVSSINSSLKSEINVTQAKKIKTNLPLCFRGVEPNGAGFIVTEIEANNWIKANHQNQEVLKLFSMGANLAQHPHGKPERWIIDFDDRDLESASEYILPLERLRSTIPQERSDRPEKLKTYWWKHRTKCLDLRRALASLPYSFAVPRVSKWAIFIPFQSTWLAGDKSVVVATDDFYILGILTSQMHRLWMHAQSSTLKADIAYTPSTCFDTFPFPQHCLEKTKTEIRAAMQSLHNYRTEEMECRHWGITQLYNHSFAEPTSQLAQLHNQLDYLAYQAYDIKPHQDPLKFLLDLNFAITQQET